MHCGLSGLVVGVCASLGGWVLAAPLPFQGPVYHQDFEGLTWNKDNIAQPGFGSNATGTEGWLAYSPEGGAIVTTYRSRTLAAPKSEATVVGHVSIPPTDNAIGRHAAGNPRFLMLYLKNDTGNTITSVSVSYDVELWTKPTSNISHGLTTFWDIGDYWTNALAPLADTYFPTSRRIGRHEFTTASVAGTEIRHSVTLDNIVWPVGQSFVVKWEFSGEAYNANHITAIDNVTIAIPEPGIVLAAIVVGMSALSIRRRSA